MTDSPDAHSALADWWATSITNIEPGVIEYQGVSVADAIKDYSLTEIVWLLLRGERPSPSHASLLEAALIASVDHGPQAPSIAAARMAATCGVGLNNAIATGINVLGDVHGGVGQQCLEFLNDVLTLEHEGFPVDDAAARTVGAHRAEQRYVPGFGHRFHPIDPRQAPLIDLVQQARDDGEVPGDHVRAALAVEFAVASATGKDLPMNIDMLTAIIYGELGFPPPLARGLFVLGRSVGVLAHAWEESQSGRRIKGPMPPSIRPTYRGPSSTARAGQHDSSSDD